MVFLGLIIFSSFLTKILRMWKRRGSAGSVCDEFHRKKIETKKILVLHNNEKKKCGDFC